MSETGKIPSDFIKREALKQGFSFCGVARSEPLEELRSRYVEFLDRGVPSGLQYLEKNLEKRLNPERVMEGVHSVIALMLNYKPSAAITHEDNFIISSYAYGRDYHTVMHDKMKSLMRFMQEEYGRHQSRAFVDSGLVAEKAWARQCGIGWQGKNTLVINKTGGSFCFIGIIYTELNLEADAPETDRCGDCQNCIKACPAGALHTPYRLDIEKCISYQTIENRQEIPPEVRPTLRNRIYGCDICQDVCPFNRHAKSHCVPEFNPSPALWKFRKKEWSELTEDLFASIFENSSIYRTGYAKFMSNIAAVREQSDPSPGYS